jgi:hypothetical protein
LAEIKILNKKPYNPIKNVNGLKKKKKKKLKREGKREKAQTEHRTPCNPNTSIHDEQRLRDLGSNHPFWLE